MTEKLCKYCNEPVNRKKIGIQCSGFCAQYCHGQCINIVGKQLDAIRMEGVSWKCAECRTSLVANRARQSFGGAAAIVPSQTPTHSSGNHEDVLEAVQDLKQELRHLREQQNALMESVNFCSGKISDFENKLVKFDEYIKKTDKLIAENARLANQVTGMESKINDLEQISRSQNLEIQGIPEKNNENLMNVLEKIGNYINYNISPEKVDYVHRVQLNRNSNNGIKNIVVRLTSIKEKENILAAAKNKRMQKENGSPKMKIDGLSDHLYINEHLTLANKMLYKEVRTAAKAKGYKFFWTKNGAIFARKNEVSRVILIKNEEAIRKM